ncbi:ESCRT-I subunit protein VPS28 NDAI_0E02930 [Naumovozyma dairenensis CBS 421]|uniref:Vacuolar protein sorting-associated protein 28 n=1 Tax=Naumovozyma dairenensis (strain ATCC 10597 / BCRC 20456 / CBS 421 / NBRC 0211 / NRRL Y-12639) TaxID=1071378 RepID=G0WBJ0_NAUDC|nr:hypothetical protein NDAI_0E02930 [Naumovozyma dairenensis CBS 421]CCD25110.1 hypothetical protein NDAI_0E02930 [Naumovozyma dairenensis CBS 421]
MSGIAPINHFGTQNSTRPFPQELYQEVPLFDSTTTNSQQRETIESLSEIYSIIITLDHVEKAYLRDSITSSQYTNTVNKLLAQYKTYLSNEDVSKAFQSLNDFKTRFNIVASNAITRLERGIPVTVEHAIEEDVEEDESSETQGGQNTNRKKGKFTGKNVAEATGNFITVMDALKLNYRAKDQLHPLLAELLLSINRVTNVDFEHRKKLIEWIVKINKMDVNQDLSDNQARELLFDLDLAYKSFYALLE